MEVVMSLPASFQGTDAGLFRRRLFYSAVAVLYIVLLGMSAENCRLQSMAVMYENQDTNAPAGEMNVRKMTDTAAAIEDVAAVFPPKAVDMNELGNFICLADGRAALIQAEPKPELKPEPGRTASVESPIAADIAIDIENPVEKIPEAPAVPDIENPATPVPEAPAVPDEGEPVIPDIENPSEGLFELETGVFLDASGHIVSCSSGSGLVADGYLCLPWNAACTGIEAGALDDVRDMIFEIYIPANITYIAPGALDGLGNLFYIYAEPDNPVYASDDEGILYRKSDGAQIAYPHGRDCWQ